MFKDGSKMLLADSKSVQEYDLEAQKMQPLVTASEKEEYSKIVQYPHNPNLVCDSFFAL